MTKLDNAIQEIKIESRCQGTEIPQNVLSEVFATSGFSGY
jgi:hypothetical protein